MKLETLKNRNQDAFKTFCEVMRAKQPFLKKATDDELEGIFLRMTPSERLKYVSENALSGTKKRPSEESRASNADSTRTEKKSDKKEKKEKKQKKLKREYSFDNFIDDRVIDDEYDNASSDDVSLVSESATELLDDIPDDVDSKKKDKKKKKKSHKETVSVRVPDTPSKVQHFKWS